MDNWAHRSESMKCGTCMHFCAMRCRRKAPTMAGFPAVFPDDWCGEHKLDKETMKEIVHSKTTIGVNFPAKG